MKPHLYPYFSLTHRLNLVGWLRIGLLLGHTALARIVTRTNSGGPATARGPDRIGQVNRQGAYEVDQRASGLQSRFDGSYLSGLPWPMTEKEQLQNTS